MKKFISLFVLVAFVTTSVNAPLYAQVVADQALHLPQPGTMVNLSPAYQPALIKGLTIHKDNPFLFDFIVDTGHSGLAGDALKKEGDRLVKYFFACLTIPEKDLWVNLSPYEKDRMIPNALGKTALGRDLLAEDYILKQLTASLIYPEKDLGKEFWDPVYAKAQQMYGTNQIPVNTFNKVWILADHADVFENGQTAFVLDGHLKVMLDEDYLSLQKHSVIASEAKQSHTIASQIVRQIILPEIEKEVNTGKNFATLRQIYNSMILASWYKKNLKEALLNQVYADKSTVKGVNLADPSIKERIYQQYLQAYKKGVFDYIKEDIQADNHTIPKKYFSGGFGVAGDCVHTLTRASSGATGRLTQAMSSLGKIFIVASIIFLNGSLQQTSDTNIVPTPSTHITRSTFTRNIYIKRALQLRLSSSNRFSDLSDLGQTMVEYFYHSAPDGERRMMQSEFRLSPADIKQFDADATNSFKINQEKAMLSTIDMQQIMPLVYQLGPRVSYFFGLYLLKRAINKSRTSLAEARSILDTINETINGTTNDEIFKPKINRMIAIFEGMDSDKGFIAGPITMLASIGAFGHQVQNSQALADGFLALLGSMMTGGGTGYAPWVKKMLATAQELRDATSGPEREAKLKELKSLVNFEDNAPRKAMYEAQVPIFYAFVAFGILPNAPALFDLGGLDRLLRSSNIVLQWGISAVSLGLGLGFGKGSSKFEQWWQTSKSTQAMVSPGYLHGVTNKIIHNLQDEELNPSDTKAFSITLWVKNDQNRWQEPIAWEIAKHLTIANNAKQNRISGVQPKREGDTIVLRFPRFHSPNEGIRNDIIHILHMWQKQNFDDFMKIVPGEAAEVRVMISSGNVDDAVPMDYQLSFDKLGGYTLGHLGLWKGDVNLSVNERNINPIEISNGSHLIATVTRVKDEPAYTIRNVSDNIIRIGLEPTTQAMYSTYGDPSAGIEVLLVNPVLAMALPPLSKFESSTATGVNPIEFTNRYKLKSEVISGERMHYQLINPKGLVVAFLTYTTKDIREYRQVLSDMRRNKAMMNRRNAIIATTVGVAGAVAAASLLGPKIYKALTAPNAVEQMVQATFPNQNYIGLPIRIVRRGILGISRKHVAKTYGMAIDQVEVYNKLGVRDALSAGRDLGNYYDYYQTLSVALSMGESADYTKMLMLTDEDEDLLHRAHTRFYTPPNSNNGFFTTTDRMLAKALLQAGPSVSKLRELAAIDKPEGRLAKHVLDTMGKENADLIQSMDDYLATHGESDFYWDDLERALKNTNLMANDYARTLLAERMAIHFYSNHLWSMQDGKFLAHLFPLENDVQWDGDVYPEWKAVSPEKYVPTFKQRITARTFREMYDQVRAIVNTNTQAMKVYTGKVTPTQDALITVGGMAYPAGVIVIGDNQMKPGWFPQQVFVNAQDFSREAIAQQLSKVNVADIQPTDSGAKIVADFSDTIAEPSSGKFPPFETELGKIVAEDLPRDERDAFLASVQLAYDDFTAKRKDATLPYHQKFQIWLAPYAGKLTAKHIEQLVASFRLSENFLKTADLMKESLGVKTLDLDIASGTLANIIEAFLNRDDVAAELKKHGVRVLKVRAAQAELEEQTNPTRVITPVTAEEAKKIREIILPQHHYLIDKWNEQEAAELLRTDGSFDYQYDVSPGDDGTFPHQGGPFIRIVLSVKPTNEDPQGDGLYRGPIQLFGKRYWNISIGHSADPKVDILSFQTWPQDARSPKTEFLAKFSIPQGRLKIFQQVMDSEIDWFIPMTERLLQNPQDKEASDYLRTLIQQRSTLGLRLAQLRQAQAAMKAIGSYEEFRALLDNLRKLFNFGGKEKLTPQELNSRLAAIRREFNEKFDRPEFEPLSRAIAALNADNATDFQLWYALFKLSSDHRLGLMWIPDTVKEFKPDANHGVYVVAQQESFDGLVTEMMNELSRHSQEQETLVVGSYDEILFYATKSTTEAELRDQLKLPRPETHIHVHVITYAPNKLELAKSFQRRLFVINTINGALKLGKIKDKLAIYDGDNLIFTSEAGPEKKSNSIIAMWKEAITPRFVATRRHYGHPDTINPATSGNALTNFMNKPRSMRQMAVGLLAASAAGVLAVEGGIALVHHIAASALDEAAHSTSAVRLHQIITHKNKDFRVTENAYANPHLSDADKDKAVNSGGREWMEVAKNPALSDVQYTRLFERARESFDVFVFGDLINNPGVSAALKKQIKDAEEQGRHQPGFPFMKIVFQQMTYDQNDGSKTVYIRILGGTQFYRKLADGTRVYDAPKSPDLPTNVDLTGKTDHPGVITRFVRDSKGNWVQTNTPASTQKAMSNIQGGIDFSNSNMAMTVTKDAHGGVQVSFDPALIAQIRVHGVWSAQPFIIRVTPMDPEQIKPLLGLGK